MSRLHGSAAICPPVRAPLTRNSPSALKRPAVLRPAVSCTHSNFLGRTRGMLGLVAPSGVINESSDHSIGVPVVKASVRCRTGNVPTATCQLKYHHRPQKSLYLQHRWGTARSYLSQDAGRDEHRYCLCGSDFLGGIIVLAASFAGSELVVLCAVIPGCRDRFLSFHAVSSRLGIQNGVP